MKRDLINFSERVETRRIGATKVHCRAVAPRIGIGVVEAEAVTHLVYHCIPDRLVLGTVPAVVVDHVGPSCYVTDPRHRVPSDGSPRDVGSRGVRWNFAKSETRLMPAIA